MRSRKKKIIGILAAWATSIAVAYLAGILYAFLFEKRYPAHFSSNLGVSDAGNLDHFFLIGSIVAVTAAVITTLATIFIAWPLYIFSRRLKIFTLWVYFFSGIIIGSCVLVVLGAIQIYLGFFSSIGNYWFEILTILIASTTATVIFGMIVRTKSASARMRERSGSNRVDR